MNDDRKTSGPGRGPDAIAELIRKAGNLPEPSGEFRRRLHGELRSAWRNEVNARRRRERWIAGAKAAAIVMLLVAAGLQFLPRADQPVGTLFRATPDLTLESHGNAVVVKPGVDIVPGSRLVTGNAPAAFELRNGFNVRLDARTRLTVISAGRLELQSGRIYADSQASDSELVIDTPLGNIRDIGTQFAVALEAERLSVQVRDGQVTVQKPRMQVDVRAGQRVRLSTDGNVQTESITLAGESWLWTEAVAPRIAVDNVSMRAFLEAVHRQTGLAIRYASEDVASKAAKTILRGKHPDLPPRKLLDVVMSATGFAHEITGSEVLVFAD